MLRGVTITAPQLFTTLPLTAVKWGYFIDARGHGSLGMIFFTGETFLEEVSQVSIS